MVEQGMVQAADENDEGNRDFVTSIARAFSILRAFKRGDRALGNKEIARRTGLPKSSVARIAYTLTRLGYLEFLPEEEKYSLGIGVLALGQRYLSGLDVREVARPLMQGLADFSKATVALAARDDVNMVFLEIRHGDPLFRLRLDVGESVEAYADRLLEMADWLGEDHVAFGSDMNGLGRHAVINAYSDFPRVMAHWEKRRVPEGRVRKLAIENYARVLRQALG